jgi:hypothetical protein
MPERTSITQVQQVGVEVTPGTAVAATRRLQSVSISISPNPETSQFRPKGTKFPTVSVLNREWSTLSIEGQPTYNEMAYLWSSVLNTAAPTGPVTGAYTWSFQVGNSTADTPKTYTVEEGSSVRAHRVAHAIVDALTIEFSRESISLSGGGFAQALQDGVALSGGTTTTSLVPMLPGQVCVYKDTTSAGLGTTLLLRVLSGSVNVSGRWGPLWTVNCTLNSFATYVELEPTVELKIMVEADAQGMAMLDDLRTGAGRFYQVAITGGIIGGAIPYSQKVNLFGIPSEIGEYADEQGVYAIEFTIKSHYDATWTKALEVLLVNTLAAL